MATAATRAGLALCAIAFLCPGYGQSSDPQPPPQNIPDHLIYGGFLQHVYWAKRFEEMRSRSDAGNKPPFPSPTMQEAAGLTDQEVQVLNKTADDYFTRTSAILKPFSKFEIILQTIESGGMPSSLADNLERVEQERKEMISDVRQLRERLGASRFEMLDAYIRQPENARKWPALPLLIPPDTVVLPAK